MQNIQLHYTDIFDSNKQKELTFSKDLLPHKYSEKSLFALIVDGESMQPLIQNRAVVVCDLSLKELEDENAKLKKMFADMALENHALKDLLEKKL